MNATIVKNSTVVTLVNDYKYDLKRDGGFDTFKINFYSTEKDLLNRWDRVLVDGVTWRVAELPRVKINYAVSEQWLYTVNLVELAAILDGVQLPNIAFTQDLAQTKTYADALEEILSKQEVHEVGETPRYSLVSSPSVSLSGIASDEIFPELSLYQIMKYYAEIFDAKVTLNADDEIDFIPLNDYSGTLSPTFTSIEKSESTEEYATDLIEDAENVDTGDTEWYPFETVRIFLAPEDFAANTAFDNIRIELPHKVKRVDKIVFFENLSDNVTLEYGTEIFEEQQWNSLKPTSFWSFIPNPHRDAYRENTVFFKYGDNKLYNLIAIKERRLNPFTTLVHEITLHVYYEPLEDIQIKRSSGVTLDGDIRFTKRSKQNAKTINYAAEKLRIQNELANKQSVDYNCVWTQASFSLADVRKRVEILSSYALIRRMVVERIGNNLTGSNFEVNATLSTAKNSRNPLTKLISENRIFEIPSSQTVLRKVVWEHEATISVLFNDIDNQISRWDDYAWGIFIPVIGARFGMTEDYFEDNQIMMFAEFKYKTPFDGNTHVAVGMPTNVTLDEDTIIVVAKMTSNTSMDYQRYVSITDKTAASAIVCDENGEVDTVDFNFIAIEQLKVVYENDNDVGVTFQEAYPFVSQEFFETGWHVYTVGSDVENPNEQSIFKPFTALQVNKDRREQLQFEYRIKLKEGTNTFIYEDEFLASSRFKKKPSDCTWRIRLFLLSPSYNGYVDVSSVEVGTSYVKLHFTAPASGNLGILSLYDGTNRIMNYSPDTISSVVLTESASYYVSINFKE